MSGEVDLQSGDRRPVFAAGASAERAAHLEPRVTPDLGSTWEPSAS